MKRTYVALLILLTLAGGSFLHIRKMNQLTDELITQIQHSQTAYQEGHSQLAEEALRKAMNHWNQADGYTHIFLDHDKIQSIDDGFYDILAPLPDGSEATVITAYHRLQENLTALCQEEQLRLESVF